MQTELAKTDEAINRYLAAFENGTMPEALCAPRIAQLAEKSEQVFVYLNLGCAPGLQAALYAHARDAIRDGGENVARQLMQARIHR